MNEELILVNCATCVVEFNTNEAKVVPATPIVVDFLKLRVTTCDPVIDNDPVTNPSKIITFWLNGVPVIDDKKLEQSNPGFK